MTPWLLATVLGAAPTLTGLATDWSHYVDHYIEDGRVVDPSRQSITTSEGQAYGMLRAVWMDDRATFETLRTWTARRLQRCPKSLPSWKWGENQRGRWAVLDRQPAPDADLLMAYALLLADQRWQEPAWTKQARGILRRVWRKEVVRAGDRWVLVAGPWAADAEPLRVNPSYILPFVFRAAAVVDPQHPWLDLLADSYALLAEVHGPLPPDWADVDPGTGSPISSDELYGWEAVRIPWALEADLRWHEEPRAAALLGAYGDLAHQFLEQDRLGATTDRLGRSTVDYESRALYAAMLPTWGRLNPAASEAGWARVAAISPSTPGSDYYADNWVWFGGALTAGLATPWDAAAYRADANMESE